jgi:hypothetical protein
MTTSKHYMEDRKAREAKIQQIGCGKIVSYMVVDKGHRNGPEVHMLSTTGIVTIFNQRSGKMITRLIARPAQVKRFPHWTDEIVEIARAHAREGYYNV